MRPKMEIPIALLLIFGAVLTRLIPHPANFTAIGALAIWSGVFFPRRAWGPALSIAAMVISDVFFGWHSTLLWVYGSFLVISLLSLWAQMSVATKESNFIYWGRLLGSAVGASLVFFTLTNFGFWTTGELYPFSATGLLECFIAGLPFLKGQLAGDLFYTVAMGVLLRVLLGERRLAVQRVR